MPDSGTATSVSVAVDVTHTYIGDLKIDLIAPDGTTKTFTRAGGATDDIDKIINRGHVDVADKRQLCRR